MEWLVLTLALLGLGLGLGLGFLKIVPKPVVTVLSIVATVVVTVQLWQLVGLPDVDLLNKFATAALVSAPAVGFVAGEKISSLVN